MEEEEEDEEDLEKGRRNEDMMQKRKENAEISTIEIKEHKQLICNFLPTAKAIFTFRFHNVKHKVLN